MRNDEIENYLRQEMNDTYLAAKLFDYLPTVFPISPETALFVVDHAEMKHRDNMERLLFPQRYWENYFKTKEAVARGDTGVEEVTFQKIDTPGGYTFEVAYSPRRDTLIFRR